jgi:hypothetical protein
LTKFHIFNDDSYYLVNNTIEYSKLRAIELANGDLNKIQFSWMENTWANIDWTIDPKESWSELLRTRCQQIRDKYTYLALWYSSGYDSHTILRAFVDNDILLDELLIYDRRDFFDDPEVAVAITHANYIKNTYYPNLKINVVRSNASSIENFYNKFGEDWVYHPGYSLKISKTSRVFATTVMDDFLSASYKKGIRGDIMGIDKAKVLLSNGKWYAFCSDSSAYDFMGTNQENFYYSNDLPQLHIKQCHMVIDWFESLPELTRNLVHNIQGKDRKLGGIHTKHYEDWNLAMGRCKLMHSNITSIDGTHKFFHTNDEKSPDFINYFNHIKENEKKIFKIYDDGLKRMRSYGNAIENTILSKQYYLRDRVYK